MIVTDLKTKAAIIRCQVLNEMRDQKRLWEAVDSGEGASFDLGVESPFTPAGCSAAVFLGGKVEGSSVYFPFVFRSQTTGWDVTVFGVGHTAPRVEDDPTWVMPWDVNAGS